MQYHHSSLIFGCYNSPNDDENPATLCNLSLLSEVFAKLWQAATCGADVISFEVREAARKIQGTAELEVPMQESANSLKDRGMFLDPLEPSCVHKSVEMNIVNLPKKKNRIEKSKSNCFGAVKY